MRLFTMGTLLGVLACGSVEDTTVETTPAPSVECPDETWEKLTLQLSPEDEAAQCLRTEPEERVAVPFCVDLTSGETYQCVRDEAGREYLVWASGSLIPPTGFSLCQPTEAVFNRPCYTGCSEPTLGNPWLNTLCGEEETRVAGRCGELDSAFDENCCKRPYCFDEVCPAGMTCKWFANDDVFVAIGQQTGVCGAADPWSNEEPHCVPAP
jgi:hypothetical protein